MFKKIITKIYLNIIPALLISFITSNFAYSAVAKRRNDVGEKLGIKFTPGSYRKARSSRKINYVVIHATGGPSRDPEWHFKGHDLEWTVKHFTTRKRLTSAHYVVGRDGRIVQLVKDRYIAWHAKGFNHNSIGIEMVNNGDGIDSFPEVQIISLIKLAIELKNTYGIQIKNYVSHEEVDKKKYSHIKAKAFDGKIYARKVDPGAKFPWKKFREALSEN